MIGFAKVTRDLTERRASELQAVRLAAESAARAAAEARTHELDMLNQTLQEQAQELEAQTEEAQSLTEDLEQTNTQLEEALMEAQAARAAAESSERFTREILESIADPFVVQDAQWRFRYINAKAAEVLGAPGRSTDDLIGKVVWEVYPAMVGTPVEREMRRSAAERVPVLVRSAQPERLPVVVAVLLSAARRRTRDTVEGHHGAKACGGGREVSRARERGAERVARLSAHTERLREARGARAGRLVQRRDRRRQG